MEPIYLYVPPEEYAEVEALGARWDDLSKRWYIHRGMATATFSPWMGEEEDEAEFSITSDAAMVASARAPCLQCREPIEVICIYCESGTDTSIGEPMTQITLSNVWAMDGALASQLEPWPFFRMAIGAGLGEGYFANHCPHCDAMQEDYLLHAEPGDVFFDIPRAEPGAVELTPLTGRIQLSGDYGFEI
jgi:hypothetical protein